MDEDTELILMICISIGTLALLVLTIKQFG